MGKDLQPLFDPIVLRARLAEKRLENGLTLSEISSMTGVDVSQLSRFFAGDFKLLSKNLQKVCDFLQIDPAIQNEECPEDLRIAISEVRHGWEMAGPRRKEFVEAVVALAQMAK